MLPFKVVWERINDLPNSSKTFSYTVSTMDMGTKMRATLLELKVIEIIFGPVD